MEGSGGTRYVEKVDLKVERLHRLKFSRGSFESFLTGP